jgi:DNA-binding MarR family transcriptional regulator
VIVTPFRQPPESEEVAQLTSRAAELLEVLWSRAPTTPASVSQLRVLLALEHHDGVNLRTLAQSLASTPPSTSRLCDRLQAAGLVEREVSASDRREIRLHLSGRGRSFLADLRLRRQEALSVVLDRMTARDRAALARGLEAFCDAASAHVARDAPEPADDTRTA